MPSQQKNLRTADFNQLVKSAGLSDLFEDWNIGRSEATTLPKTLGDPTRTHGIEEYCRTTIEIARGAYGANGNVHQALTNLLNRVARGPNPLTYKSPITKETSQGDRTSDFASLLDGREIGLRGLAVKCVRQALTAAADSHDIAARLFAATDSADAIAILGAGMIHAEVVPATIADKCLQIIEAMIKKDPSEAAATSPFSMCVNLLTVVKTLSSTQLQQLICLAPFCESESKNLVLSFDRRDLGELIVRIGRSFPSELSESTCDVISNPDAPEESIIMALSVACESGDIRHHVNLRRLEFLLQSKNSELQRLSVEYVWLLGSEAAPLTPQLISIAQAENDSGDEALITLGKIRRPAAKIVSLLLAQWQDAHQRMFGSEPSADILQPGMLLDSNQGRDPLLLLDSNERICGIRNPSKRVRACLTALSEMAAHSARIATAYFNACEENSAVMRNLILGRLPSTGAVQMVKPIYEFLLRTASKQDAQRIIQRLIIHYGESGEAIAVNFANDVTRVSAEADSELVRVFARKRLLIDQFIEQGWGIKRGPPRYSRTIRSYCGNIPCSRYKA